MQGLYGLVLLALGLLMFRGILKKKFLLSESLFAMLTRGAPTILLTLIVTGLGLWIIVYTLMGKKL
jgi:hypothetical protein